MLLHIRFHAWSLYHCVFILCHDFWPWYLHEAFSRGYFLPLTAPRTAVIFFTALGQRFSDRADRSRTAAWPLPLSAAVGLTGANRCLTAAYLAAVWQRSSMTFRFPKAKTTSFLLGVLYKYHLLPSSFFVSSKSELRVRNSNPRERSSQELTFTQPNHFPCASSFFLTSFKHGISCFLWLGNFYMS